MAINLKNYTSEVPVSKSIALIENKLVQAGATDISKSYQNNVCVAVRFRLMIDGSPVFFELPAKVENCFNVFWSQRHQKTAKQKTGVWQQAERTSWKIVLDWVEVQLSMILLEQAKPLQVFLPYVYNPQTNETLYDRVKGNMKLLSW